jgi:hypothetical protein
MRGILQVAQALPSSIARLCELPESRYFKALLAMRSCRRSRYGADATRNS